MRPIDPTRPCKIAMAGLGTVGAETVRLLQKYQKRIAMRLGNSVEIVAVSARDQSRMRGVDLSGYQWFADAAQMVADSDVDIVVEVIGGSDGIARQVIELALEKPCHVVTANKALMADHGISLAKKAEENGVTIAYEAAVAGGIPIIKNLREGLVGDQIKTIHGILNGTCNFILTTMRETGRSFEDVLRESQEKGYAEADPTFDIDGIDAAHKLALLASLAFGTKLDFDNVYVEGIRGISPVDMAFAEELGYRIKLLGMAQYHNDSISQWVYPAMVRKSHPIARVDGVFNAVVTAGDSIGVSVMEGLGAGGGPTASAVIADIIDIASGRMYPVFGLPVDRLYPIKTQSIENYEGTYYLRLKVVDTPGVVAAISAILRDEKISIESIIQRSRTHNGLVNLVITTHQAKEHAIQVAMAKIRQFDWVKDKPHLLRIAAF